MGRLSRTATGATVVVALLAFAPVAVGEPLPGPPARPGRPPVGGPLLTGTEVVMRPVGAAVTPPRIDVAAWLLADASTGEVLAAKGPHLRYRPASTLKTLTTITVMPRLDATATYTATDADTRADGSKVGLVAGAPYTIDDLWHALLLPSANDAASALAHANGGVTQTVAAMNAEARRRQAYDTVAKTPSGLDADGQYISAYDMALFARAALAMPEFVRISGTTSYRFPGKPGKPGAKRPTYMIYGQNRLLNHGFPGTVAGKTGYTTQGRRTFWVAVRRDGRTLIATFLRIGESTESAAKTLITWGFAHAAQLAPVGVLVDPVAGVPSPAPAGASGTGQASSAGGSAAAPARTDAVGASSSAPFGPWVWVILLAGGLGAAVVVLRQRAVVKERVRSDARRAQRGVGPAP